MKKNKVIASVLTASMVMSSVPAWAVSASDFPDMPQNWSTAALTKAVDNGLLAGIDGKICADEYLTRAQMAAIMVRAFGADTKADLSGYTDVQQGDWYYQALSAAVSMGILSGYDSKLNPNTNITRQEVCSVVARAFMLEGGSIADLRQFSDADAVGGWAQGSMAAMVAAGYLHGDNGKLKPTAYITRAEFAAIMANLASDYVNQAGIVTSVNEGNVVINAAGVTLSDVTVQGDLILADGIGLGNVNLDNVKVTGRIVVRGGGEINLTGNSNADIVKVANGNGKTEITVAEGAKVNSITSSTALDVGGKGEVGTVTVTAGTSNVTTPNTTVKNNGGIVTAAGKTVPNGATGVINNNATSATVTGGSSPAAGGGSSSSSSGGGSSSGGSSSGGSTQNESVYVLMNIPYQAFYHAEEVSDSAFAYDAISSATNKTGNYGKAGGAYHEAATASIGADGTVTAVGGANGAEFEGVIWPVKVSGLSALEALGGTKITDEDAKTVATFARGTTSSTELVGYETLMEAPSYSYYVLSEAPANYMELTVTGTTPVFKAGENAVETAEAMEATATYGGNWGDVQLGLAADDVSDKIINAVVVTAEDAAGRETKVGMVHLYNIWSANDIAWRAAQTPGLDGKTITNIRYYCSVKDTDNTDGTAPAYTNYVYDYPMNLEISAVYTGTVTAAFDGSSITVTGLPEDAQNVKAKVYHTTGGRNPVYTYLTPLAVDPADDDIDPVTVNVVDGKIPITPGSVTNQAGTTAEYGKLTEATEYTIELSSDNWMINKVTAVYEGDNAGKGEAETAQLIENVQVVDVGWAQYLVVDLQEGSAANYEFAVDGQAVDVSPIDDAANLVKWELSSLQPGQLTVTRKLDGKQQTVTVTEGAAADTVRPSATAGPDYFLAHGSVYVWDYALTNYDAAGNVRVNPAKTTFDLAEEASSSTVAYYAPDAVLKAGGDNVYGVSGEVEVLFNYTTDADKAWFDSITDVDLVEYNDSLGTLNDTLDYKLDTTDHHGSTVGQLTVPLGQSNFYSNGRYYLRVTSGGAATLIPIHVVNEQAPSMALSEGTITSGQNVHFKVSDMTYGITMPIYRVDLTAPDKSTRTLEKIRDWYLIGDTFVLYNDVEVTDGRDNIPENGSYTLTVYADGFKTMTKSFKVGNESKVSYVDAVSHATGAGSGGSSESGSEGGSNTMDANLLFDADLLANALILQDLDIENAYAAGIAERWLYDMSGWDAAFYQDGQTFYTYTGFRDAVETAKVNGQYLTFQDYVASGNAKTTLNRPYAVKAVLEDNLLGETQTNGAYLGNAAADLFLVDGEGNGLMAAQEGKEVIFSCADADYLAAIAENGQIYLNGNGLKSLEADVDYRVEDGKLIISADVLQLGENHLVIEAAGYKALRLTVTVEKVLEEYSFITEESYAIGEAVTLTCQSETGDYLKHLKSVILVKPDGTEKTVRLDGEESVFEKIGYAVDGTVLELGKDLFTETGSYAVKLHADYYEDVAVTVTIAEKTTTEPTEPEQPGETLTAPLPTGYTNSWNSQLEFGGSCSDYLAAIQAVSVDGVSLDKASSSWSLASGSFYTSQYGTGITFGSDILKDENITVVVKADGYQDLIVVLDKDGNIVTGNTGSEGEDSSDNEGDDSSGTETNSGDNNQNDEDGQIMAVPTAREWEKDSFGFSGHKMYFDKTGSNTEATAYLQAINFITVNGNTSNGYVVRTGTDQYIQFDLSLFSKSETTTITIHATGYEDLTVYIDKDGNLLDEEALLDTAIDDEQGTVVDDADSAADMQQENAAEAVNDASQQGLAINTEAEASSL